MAKWTKEEEGNLRVAIGQFYNNWEMVSGFVGTKSADSCEKKARREGWKANVNAVFECKAELGVVEIERKPYEEKLYLPNEDKNVLVFSCTHIPFERPGYLEFLQKIKKKYNCKRIICNGDLVDEHGLSFHDHDPDGYSAGLEGSVAKRTLKSWIKAFPEMVLVIGNHDARPMRVARKSGIPNRAIKTLNEMWDLPDSWQWAFKIQLNGVIYKHGGGGKYPYANAAYNHSMSCVTSHAHSVMGISYHANEEKKWWGMGIGSGLNDKTYAMEYGRDFDRKSIIGCGVVLNQGKTPILELMDL